MTSTEQIDVPIIGSGPAGMSVGLHLVQTDAAWAERVLIIDKAVHPREKLCGGGRWVAQSGPAKAGLARPGPYSPVGRGVDPGSTWPIRPLHRRHSRV